MRAFNENLKAHLETGVTTACRCWIVTRRDGVVMGFTDHDLPLEFEDVIFRADTGLSALALQQSTGLSVDNTEAIGALSDAAIREADIEAGRYDGAEVQAWLVNWQDVEERQLQFRGLIGELRRQGGAFEAELRGLTDVLNQPHGKVYQRPCNAVLGDGACGFNLNEPGYFSVLPVEAVEERRVFRFDALEAFSAEWFQYGVLRVLSGAAEGLSGVIKRDIQDADGRFIELWHPLRADIKAGDLLRLEAGCDKRSITCHQKFSNYLNYQGFPDIPGDDWSVTDPVRSGRLDGGSRRR